MGNIYRRGLFGSAVMLPAPEQELANFYVDPDTGDDSSFNGTTQEKPFRTWAPINAMTSADLGAGKVVRQKRSTVNRSALTCPTSGAAGSPILFGAYGVGHRPVTNAAYEARAIASGWTLSGSEYRLSTSATTYAGNYIWWRRFGATIPLAKGTYGSLTAFQYAMSGTTLSVNIGRAVDHFDCFEIPQRSYGVGADGKSFLQFKGLAIKHSQAYAMEFATTAAVDNIIIEDCDLSACIADLVNTFTYATNFTIRKSWLHDQPNSTGDAFSAHSANSNGSTTVFEDNLVQNITKNGIAHDQLGTHIIRRNRFEAANLTIYTSATGTPGTTQIYRNIITGDIPASAGAIYAMQLAPASGCTIYAYHNTLVAGLSANASYRGIASFPASGGTNVIKNNILRGTYGIGIYHNGAGTTTEDYNQVHQATTRYSGLSAGAHSLNSDPAFISEAAGDFGLLTGSPCKNAGVVLAGFNDDYFGAAPDMGAIERMVA